MQVAAEHGRRRVAPQSQAFAKQLLRRADGTDECDSRSTFARVRTRTAVPARGICVARPRFAPRGQS
jgi:hypothetical protein